MKQIKEKDSFDITKIVLSVFVVAIHTMGKYAPYPVLRIAVPVFFIMSGYLFFSKNDVRQMKTSALYSFVKRNLRLYAFWFIMLLPITIYRYYCEGLFATPLRGIVKLVVRFLFGSTFSASWYLMALIIGVCFVFYSCKFKSGTFVSILAIFCFVLCCLSSNYRKLFSEQRILMKLLFTYPGTIYNSFPVSLIWIIIGKRFADYECKNEQKRKFSKWCIMFGISFALLILEYMLITYLNCCVDNDCYFMLLPVCTSLFGIILNINTKCKYAKKMRQASTVIYCLHGSVAIMLKQFFVDTKIVNVDLASGALLLFAITLMLCAIVARGILKLEKISGFKWIRIAH